MKSRDIILIDFPFIIPTQSKIRPAVVITTTADKYVDIVVCAISSVVPTSLSPNEVLIQKSDPSFQETGLRVDSVFKVDRIATLRQVDMVIKLGRCDDTIWRKIAEKFKQLVD